MANKRYRVINHDEYDYELDYIADSENNFKKVDLYDCCDLLNELNEENQRLNEFKNKLFRLINDNIEFYENINTDVEFHRGEINGKLTLLYNLKNELLKW